jgi:hypothetical protein
LALRIELGKLESMQKHKNKRIYFCCIAKGDRSKITKQEQQSVQADPRAGKIDCEGQDAEKSTRKANSYTSSCVCHKSDSGLATRAEHENENSDP